jgi:3-oxoacyl-[acyl-carrier-protein] synthase-3
MYKNILVIGSEVHSTGLIWQLVVGVSVILEMEQEQLYWVEDLTKGIFITHLHSEGQHAEELALIAPGTRWVGYYSR